MKSYFLEESLGPAALEAALDELLPIQRRPWVLCTASGDALAYFNVVNDDGAVVQADISGRHFHEDEKVLSVLRALKARLGGRITNDSNQLVD